MSKLNLSYPVHHYEFFFYTRQPQSIEKVRYTWSVNSHCTALKQQVQHYKDGYIQASSSYWVYPNVGDEEVVEAAAAAAAAAGGGGGGGGGGALKSECPLPGGKP